MVRDARLYRMALHTAISQLDESQVREHLVDAIHSLSMVATGMDGDEELTLESMKAGARGLLVSLGYNINE